MTTKVAEENLQVLTGRCTRLAAMRASYHSVPGTLISHVACDTVYDVNMLSDAGEVPESV